MTTVKKAYNLFYDEAFHDRKLTEKDKDKGEINTENSESGSNNADNFVTAVIGFETSQTETYFEKYRVFEEKTKQLLGLHETKEFKGITIGKQNFKYGIKSFNKNTLKIYSDYFDLLDKDIFIQISSLNKFEQIVISMLRKGSLSPAINVEAFIYSLIKFMNHYKNKHLVGILFDETTTSKQLFNTVVNLLREVFLVVKDVPRKSSEANAILQMLMILETNQIEIETAPKYDWDYSRAIDGIRLLLEELQIEESSCTLDIDYEKKTIETAKRYNFKKVTGVKSEDYIGVRFSDILCNFIGRMLKSIDDEYLEDWDDLSIIDNIEERRILSEEWFSLSEKQFLLYKKIANVFYERKDIYWTVQTGLYAGHSAVFFSLIYYIGLYYDSYTAFKEVNISEHRERFNAECTDRENRIFEL